MKALRRLLPPGSAHAVRIAATATVLIGVVYAGCVAVVDRVVDSRLVAAVDARLQDGASDVAGSANPRSAAAATVSDADDPPLYLWLVPSGRGEAVSLSPGAPRLPGGIATSASSPAGQASLTVQLARGTFRLDTMRDRSGMIIAGQSLAEQTHIESVLSAAEELAAPVLLLAVFAGALIIGVRALSPVEQSRRRQLEFTADASHELRTPLSVISAETSLALGTSRQAADYRAALGRIQGESDRLRRIVEDLLWLARFDSHPPQPKAEPLDLATIAHGCADRFGAVARAQSITMTVVGGGTGHAWVSAPPEWIERLAGVLADNACRHAGPSGRVRIRIGHRAGRVTLTVEDSGSGVRPEDRDRLFDRFHRATEAGGGAGLGLAIADSIVRSTSGQWHIGNSPLGGALFQVSWRRAAIRQLAPEVLTEAVNEPAESADSG
jgi:signal transduction histidine kinase